MLMSCVIRLSDVFPGLLKCIVLPGLIVMLYYNVAVSVNWPRLVRHHGTVEDRVRVNLLSRLHFRQGLTHFDIHDKASICRQIALALSRTPARDCRAMTPNPLFIYEQILRNSVGEARKESLPCGNGWSLNRYCHV